MGVMNRSVNKAGQGWTRRTWEEPEVRRLKWHEWSPAYRQKCYFFITRTSFVVGSTAALFIFGKIFLPYSNSTKRQNKAGDYMGVSDPEMKENLRRRYGKSDSETGVKSEIERLTEQWAPDAVKNFRERLDDFIRRTADRFLGENRVNPEVQLYSEVKKNQNKLSGSEELGKT